MSKGLKEVNDTATEFYCNGFIRNQFAVTGGVDAVKKYEIYETVKKYARQAGMRVDDYMYKAIGIEPTEQLGEEDVYKAKKYMYANDEGWLKRLADSKKITVEELRREVGTLTLVEEYITLTGSDASYVIANVLTKMHDKALGRGEGKPPISVADLMSEIKQVQGKQKLEYIANLIQIGVPQVLEQMLPKPNQSTRQSKFVAVYQNEIYGVKKEDMLDAVIEALYLISGSKYLISMKLLKLLNDIVRNAGGVNSLDLALQPNMKPIWNLLVAASIKFQEPIAEILAGTGYKFNDYGKISLEGFMVVDNYQTALIVMNCKAKDKEEFIVVNEEQFAKLYNQDVLKDYEFVDGKPTLTETGETVANILFPYGTDKVKSFI